MYISITSNTWCALKILFFLFVAINGRMFPGDPYYSHNYYDELYGKIKMGLSELQHDFIYDGEWPSPVIKLGQVSGVTVDNSGQLVAFHRANNVWDESTFSERNIYQNIGDPPISQPTILVFNETGDIIDAWGENLFYIPHGITIDVNGNTWVTDVALHQVFKFTPQQRKEPELVLGEKFVPRDDDTHFCKPAAVAVLPSGDFFVADGYCNSRIIKFAPDGTKILQWGRHKGVNSPFTLNVPHALTLVPEHDAVCVADRENGRVSCFRSDNGTFIARYQNWLLGSRIFSVAYSAANGGHLYVVNGPDGQVPVRGYVIEYISGRLVGTFAPEGDFSNPHDIAVSSDSSNVYVAEIKPFKIHRFIRESTPNETRADEMGAIPVKPTVTIEASSSLPSEAVETSWWRGGGGAMGAGAGAGAAGALLLALAATSLMRARNNGRKSLTRRHWEYGQGEFKLRRLLERRRFTRVHSDDSEDEPSPMLLPNHAPANA